MRTLSDVDPSDYDFLDFGAGIGNSMLRCQRLFGGWGLGIDINESKIEEAARLDRDVVHGDILSLPAEKLVSYVSMDNFLEHLPDEEAAAKMVKMAAQVATDFVYIVHPSFDDEAYLRAVGFKQYWHDWTGHPTHLLFSDLVRMLREAGVRNLEVEYSGPANDSSHPSILPVAAPRDQHDYDKSLHGPKEHVQFAKPVFSQIRIRGFLGAGGDSESLAMRSRLAELEGRRVVRFANATWHLRQVRRPAELPGIYRRFRAALRR